MPRQPRYAEILAELRGDITGGVFAIGGALPSEAALCERFKASRFTVREALSRLQTDGLIRRVQGAGSTVIRDRPALVQDYHSVQELDRYAEATHYELRKIDVIELSGGVAARIGAAAGETWLRLDAVRRQARGAAGVLAVVESYAPVRFAPVSARLGRGPGPVHAELSDACGEPVIRAWQETEALAAPEAIAEDLGVAPASPVLRLLRAYESRSGLLIASFNWHRSGERYVHRADLSLTRSAT